jgi:hypothetical protein
MIGLALPRDTTDLDTSKNNYDTKLANAYRKWVRIVDERGTVKPPDYEPEPIKPEYEPERIDETETHWLVSLVRILIGIFKK